MFVQKLPRTSSLQLFICSVLACDLTAAETSHHFSVRQVEVSKMNVKVERSLDFLFHIEIEGTRKVGMTCTLVIISYSKLSTVVGSRSNDNTKCNEHKT